MKLLRIAQATRRKFNLIDQLSAPYFISTMVLESRRLRQVPTRPIDSLDGLTRDELADPSLPADPLVPVGYERRDTASSLGALVGSVMVGAALEKTLMKVFGSLYKRRLTDLGDHPGSLASAMVLWDFLYYWEHRWMHEVRLLWANHAVHHSSRHYNLSTALRQGWLPFLVAGVFTPMPLLGYRPETIRRAGQLNLLYQYWIHTELIDRLPAPVEAVFNTPSHHRVHHGVNPQYIDRNYGGILIVWDRLFGTFEPEVRAVKYGLTKNIDTYNPVVAALGELGAILRDAAGAQTMGDRFRYVFARPGWQPEAA